MGLVAKLCRMPSRKPPFRTTNGKDGIAGEAAIHGPQVAPSSVDRVTYSTLSVPLGEFDAMAT